jgi:CBS domain containing-hemolysin-like protein
VLLPPWSLLLLQGFHHSLHLLLLPSSPEIFTRCFPLFSLTHVSHIWLIKLFSTLSFFFFITYFIFVLGYHYPFGLRFVTSPAQFCIRPMRFNY